jgi:type II secretory pathway component PulM
MKKYLEQLRPQERRLVIGVAVVFLVVLNWWFVWPHFSDWGNLRQRLATAERKLKLCQAAVAQIPTLTADVKKYENEGEFVTPEDQAINFMRTIQAQASACGFGIENYSRAQMHTNDAFFVEQVQTITVLATEQQLVDFLYKLGSGASMIRVRDMEIQPDPPHYHLSARIGLVASYQKNPKPAPAAAQSSTAKAK